MLVSSLSFGQTSTEVFETETHNSTNFTDNGVIFNIITHTGGFDIQANYPGTGWNGTANDNRYIDNSGAGNVVTGASFSVKTTSNLFKVNKFWIFLSNNALWQNVTGTLTITGKLSGVTKFTLTKTTGFNTTYNPTTSTGTNNGFTLIDFTNLNGQNYSNIVIDELRLTTGGAYTYMQLDAFTWVKDSNILLATDETNVSSSKKELSVYPNPTQGAFSIISEKNTKAELYDQSGKRLKTLEIGKGENKADISELPAGMYLIKTEEEALKIIKK